MILKRFQIRQVRDEHLDREIGSNQPTFQLVHLADKFGVFHAVLR
jgi:hypothetical protein